MILAKGMVLEEIIGKPSTTIFNMDESGMGTFIFALDYDLMDIYHLGGHYDFACLRIDDVIFLCVKLKGSDWVSAPYSPHLAREYNHIMYEEGNGKPLTVLIVSNRTGIIQEMDCLGLGTEFSNYLEIQAEEIYKNVFEMYKYQNSIQIAYHRYASDEELAFATDVKYSID